MFRSRKRPSAFTLVELLVVIGIIALLISILLPALSKARKQANTVKCLANMKQFGNAILFYTNDWKGAMPYSGWGDFPGSGNLAGEPNPAPAGWKGWPDWLYDASSNVTPPHVTVFDSKDMKNGALYTYLGVDPLYRCPQDAGPWKNNQSQFLSSYIMSGCTNDFTGGKVYKISAFSPGSAIMWEIGTTTGGGVSNDAANFPYEAISARHNKGTSVLFIDGHCEVYNVDKYNAELDHGPSTLWCVPKSDSAVGGWTGTTNYNVPYQE